MRGHKSTCPATTSAAGGVVDRRTVVYWSVDGRGGDDDDGSQNNANLFSRGRFQLPFSPEDAFLFFRIPEARRFRVGCSMIFIIPDVPISDPAAISTL